jgi:hypothetical protein
MEGSSPHSLSGYLFTPPSNSTDLIHDFKHSPSSTTFTPSLIRCHVMVRRHPERQEDTFWFLGCLIYIKPNKFLTQVFCGFSYVLCSDYCLPVSLSYARLMSLLSPCVVKIRLNPFNKFSLRH